MTTSLSMMSHQALARPANPPVTPLATLASARDAARRMRAEWLVALATEMVTLDDLIREAATESGRPLLKISLAQALMAMPGVGEAKKNQTLFRMSHSLGGGILEGKITISGILDARVGGRGYCALNDARRTRATPVVGFPFTSLDEPQLSRTGRES